MSDRDSKLNKYRLPMTKVIFKGLTPPISKRFCCKCYMAQTEYNLCNGRIRHIFNGLT